MALFISSLINGGGAQQYLRSLQGRGQSGGGGGGNTGSETARKNSSEGRETWETGGQRLGPQKKMGHFAKTKTIALNKKVTPDCRDEGHLSRTWIMMKEAGTQAWEEEMLGLE